MQRGTAHSAERSSNSTVVTELGGSQNPLHMRVTGISSKCASQVSPKPLWQNTAMRSRFGL